MTPRGCLDLCWAALLLANWGRTQEVVMMRNVDAFLDPVFVPDFFFDLAEAVDVMEAINSPVLVGHARASVLDEMIPHAPSMTPMLIWHTSDLWHGRQKRFQLDLGGSISGLFIDVGTHEWSRYLPRLREEPGTFLVCVEPTRAAFLELYRRLKVNYEDRLPRVLLLPVALTREADVSWGFRVLHTNDFLRGECNSLLMPNPEHGHPCTAEGPSQLVPALSLDALLGLLIDDDLDTDFNLEMKVDAQGADIDILQTLQDRPDLLGRIRDVQIEVSERVYMGQPGRSEVFQRMSALGFIPRWDLKEVHDGGVHPVSLGCRLVTDDPVTEDCFFSRLDARPFWRYLEWIFMRPFESLRMQSGLELSVSRQYGLYAERHFQGCPPNPHRIVHLCLADELGLPLGGLLHAVQYVWQVKPGDAVTVVDALLSSWPIMLTASWDKLHDAGCAFLLLTLMVETCCRGFPGLCSPTKAEESGSLSVDHCKTEECLGFWQCTTLEECWRLFLERAPAPEAVLYHPAGFATLFRSAQRLAAPRCLPREWNLELLQANDQSRPSVPCGNLHVSVVAIDSSVCDLEISLVALEAGVEEVMAYHEWVWQENIFSRPLNSTDVRLPSHGDLWSFDCVFSWKAEDGRSARVPAQTVSMSMLNEVEHHTAAPLQIVKCPPPRPVVQELEAGADVPPPSSVRLVKSPRLGPDVHMPEVELDMGLRPFTRPRVRVAMCTQQAWDFDGLEEKVPGHVEMWLRYHLEVLGIDEVYLYDLDGSFLKLPYLAEMVRRHRVIYEPTLGRIQPLSDIFAAHGYNTVTSHFAQAIIQHHCWQQAKHNADWVISVPHAWDMFLYSPSGQSLDDLLNKLEPAAITYADGVRYSYSILDHPQASSAQGHPNVFGRFTFHLDPNTRVNVYGDLPDEHIVIAPPKLVEGTSLANLAPRLEAPLFSHLLGDRWLPIDEPANKISDGVLMNRTRHLDVHSWRANHYVHLFSNRSVYTAEDKFPELRDFRYFDEHASRVGELLRAA